MDAQVAPGYFGPKLKPGKPLAQQEGLADKINKICDVLEQLIGMNGIKIDKPRVGNWSILPGTAPGEPESEYTEQENAVVSLSWVADAANNEYGLRIKRGTILAKNVTEETDLVEFKRYDS